MMEDVFYCDYCGDKHVHGASGVEGVPLVENVQGDLVCEGCIGINNPPKEKAAA